MADVHFPPDITVTESAVCSPGNTFNTFTVDGIRFGLGICYDAFFSEMSTVYRSMGCDMIFFQSAFPVMGGHFWSKIHQARAMDNQVYVAGTSGARVNDSAGFVYWGHSFFISPDGSIIKEAGDTEDIVFEEIGNLYKLYDYR